MMRLLAELKIPILGLGSINLAPFLVGGQAFILLIQIIIGLLTIALIIRKLTRYETNFNKFNGLSGNNNNNCDDCERCKEVKGSQK